MTQRALKCRLGVEGNTVIKVPGDLTQIDGNTVVMFSRGWGDKETQLCHIRAGNRVGRNQESR